MKTNNITFLLILVNLIFLSHAIIKPKTILQSCLCDISDACDEECCCDEECTVITKQWETYGKCADDGFGIPICTGFNETDIHTDDLYSGLKTIYTIMKRLFCLSRTNIIDSTSFFSATSTISTDEQTLITEAIDAEQSQGELSAIHDSVLNLTQNTVNGLFYKDGVGICQTINKIRENYNSGRQKCRVFLSATSGIDSNSILSADQLTSTLGDIPIYSMDYISSYISSNQTASAASCSSTSCSNVVRFVKLFLTSDNTISTTYSYIVVGDLTLQDNSYVTVQYDYEFLTTAVQFAVPSKQAYTMGVSLQLLQLNAASEYYKLINPLNLAYRQEDGSCQTNSTTGSSQSFIDFNFGKNAMYTCYGSSSILAAQMQELLSTNSLYVGRFGSANLVLADYVQIQWNEITISESVHLIFYYVKVGDEDNYQYQILSAKAQPVTTKNGQSTLYVEYIEVSNTLQIYIPPPPTVDAYLPNDFLSPFFIAQ